MKASVNRSGDPSTAARSVFVSGGIPRLSRRLPKLTTSGLAQLLNEGRQLGALDLALGVPQAPETSADLVNTARRVLAGGHHQYEVPDGNLNLREWIASTFHACTDPRTELTITVGATEALFIALMAVSDPGQEVVIFEPLFENFINATALCGCVPRLVRVTPPGWTYDKADLEAAFGPNTCAVIVSSPNNPTGHMFTSDELVQLSALCDRWNCVVIADEIYSGFVFGDRAHISVADLPDLRDRSFVVGSFSKSHAVSGWRLGFLRAAPPLTSAARKVHTAVTAGAAGPLQAAIAQTAATTPNFAAPGESLAPQRERTIRILEGLGLQCFEPDGGCYLMADLGGLSYNDADAFAGHLLQAAQISVAPGRFFFDGDGDAGRRLIRVAFNRSLAFLDAVEQRLQGFVPR